MWRRRPRFIVLSSVLLCWQHQSLGAAARRDASVGAEVRLSLDDQANRLWQDIPDGPAASEDDKVRRLGATPPTCATEALRRAKAAAERAALGRVAVRALAMSVSLEPAVLKEQRISSVAMLAALYDEYLQSSSEQDFVRRIGAPDATRAAALYSRFLRSRSDQVLLASPDSTCGVVRLLFDIRSLPDEPGRLYASFVAEGHCACRAPAAAPPGQKLGRWRVAALAKMKPKDRNLDEQKAEVTWELEEPRYAVLGVCGPCSKDDSEKKIADETAGQGACARCRPLEAVAKGWEEEAARAEAAAKATKEGAAAVKALTDRAAAARQAAAETRAIAGRCQKDCTVPPPIVAQSEPAKPPRSAKKIYIGAGIAVIGAGTAAVAFGGGGDSSSRTVSQPSPTVPTTPPTPRPDPSMPTPPPTTPPPPPPPTCPDVFATYTGRGTTLSNTGCAVAATFPGNMRISGTCSAALFVISENQGARTYSGTIAANGSFSGNGVVTLQGRFSANSSLSGNVSGLTLNADETLNFFAGCPGQRVVYHFAGNR